MIRKPQDRTWMIGVLILAILVVVAMCSTGCTIYRADGPCGVSYCSKFPEYESTKAITQKSFLPMGLLIR